MCFELMQTNMLSIVWKVIAVTVVAVQVLSRHSVQQPFEPGFDLFFRTNEDEFTNHPIVFDKPLPTWLHGTLIRNGLGKFENGQRSFIHVFDGFAKLASWKLRGNATALFTTKFIQSDFYQESTLKHDIASYLMFSTVDPPFNEIQKLQCLVRGIDNMNVNVYSFKNDTFSGNDFVALNDYWKIYQFDPITLDTKKAVTPPLPASEGSKENLFLNFLSSAHPLPEYGTNNHFIFVSSVSLIPWVKSKISLIRIRSTTKRELVAQWSVDHVPYMHSFSVTKNYVIVMACPFFLNIAKMLKYARPIDGLDWFPEKPTTIYLVNIKTGEVLSYKAPNVFIMHHVNAFELRENKIVVDVSTYDNPDFVKSLEVNILRDFTKRNDFNVHAELKRFIIDVSGNQVEVKSFLNNNSTLPFAAKLDMPTINEKYRYRNYCFVYGVVLKWDDTLISRIALVKKDLCSGKRDKMWFLPNHYPVEGWFVPFPEKENQLQEDDGYLLLPVLDGARGKSYLAVIDAKTMSLVNKASLPTHIPYTLHGRFFQNVS